MIVIERQKVKGTTSLQFGENREDGIPFESNQLEGYAGLKVLKSLFPLIKCQLYTWISSDLPHLESFDSDVYLQDKWIFCNMSRDFFFC